MMKKDLISIIVPVYNVEEYLDRCICSIVNQTYKNIEIILVDDGSEDESGKKCDEWKYKDTRIKVIHKENGGLSDARNIGIKNAVGELIGFIDSDDYINETFYEKLYYALITTNADMVICNYDFVDNNGILVKGNPQIIKDEVMKKSDYYNKLLITDSFYYVTAWNKLYKKEIFDDIKFPLRKLHEDEFTIHHIVSKCNIITSIKDTLYYYVQRPESIMSLSFNVKRLDAVLAFIDRYDFFCNLGNNELAIYSLKRGYSILKYGMNNLDIVDKDVIKKILFKLIIRLKYNPRTFILIFNYLKYNIMTNLKKRGIINEK